MDTLKAIEHFHTKEIRQRDQRIAELETEKKNLIQALDTAIAEIDADERYHYEPANVEINAPLALIQVALSTQMSLLKQIKSQVQS